MFAAERTATAEIVWADRDGDTARLTLRFPFSISPDTAFSAAQSIANAAQAISDAVPIRITVRYHYHEDAELAPAIDSDVGFYLCLYYSNDVDTEPIFIPSPNPALLETEGSFAGIRLNLSDPTVVALADALTAALAGTLGPDDGPFAGRVLMVGGRTR